MTRLTGTAPTASPARYAKQLASHASSFGLPVDVDDAVTTIGLPGCAARLLMGEGALVVELEADDPAALESARELVGSHLEAFGRREDLTLSWR